MIWSEQRASLMLVVVLDHLTIYRYTVPIGTELPFCQIWWIELMLLMIASSIGIALAYGYNLKWVEDLLLAVNCAEALAYWKRAVSIGTDFNFFPIWDTYWTCILNEQPSGLKAHPILAGASGSLRFLLNLIDLYKWYTDLTELILLL
jgi:hypothetical protein